MAMRVLRDEFRVKNFTYNYPDPSAFHRCQWRWPSWVYLSIRLLLILYMIYGYIHELVHYYLTAVNHDDIEKNSTVTSSQDGDDDDIPEGWDTRRPWYAFFTLWTYTVLLLHLLLAAVLSVVFSRSTETSNEIIIDPYGSKLNLTRPSSSHNIQDPEAQKSPLPENDVNPLAWYFKLSWLLSDIITPCAPIVTLIFFAALYQGGPVGVFDLNIHIFNTVFVTIDQLVSARPIKLLHGVAPVVFGIIYNTFNFIFWTSDHKEHVLYPGVMDWNDPGATLLHSAGMAFLLIPLVMLLWFIVYRLKLWIYSRVYGM